MRSSTSYLEPQEPEFAARRSERRSAPCAAFARIRVVRGCLPSRGWRR